MSLTINDCGLHSYLHAITIMFMTSQMTLFLQNDCVVTFTMILCDPHDDLCTITVSVYNLHGDYYVSSQ